MPVYATGVTIIVSGLERITCRIPVQSAQWSLYAVNGTTTTTTLVTSGTAVVTSTPSGARSFAATVPQARDGDSYSVRVTPVSAAGIAGTSTLSTKVAVIQLGGITAGNVTNGGRCAGHVEYQDASDRVTVCWTPFVDSDAPTVVLTQCQWGLSHPGDDDPFSVTTALTTDCAGLTDFVDNVTAGVYLATVVAYAADGRSGMASSPHFIVLGGNAPALPTLRMTSTPGGDDAGGGFLTTPHTVCVDWDAESNGVTSPGVTSPRISVGSTPGDSDVVADVVVGANVTALCFDPSQRNGYDVSFATLQRCSAIGVCAEVGSASVVVDSVPPGVYARGVGSFSCITREIV